MFQRLFPEHEIKQDKDTMSNLEYKKGSYMIMGGIMLNWGQHVWHIKKQNGLSLSKLS
jgi:hypothetical protein